MTELENLIEVNDNNFKEKVLNADGLVVVDFWAAWCNPCVQMGSVYAEISENFTDEVRFAKFDLENPIGRSFPDRYFQEKGIQGIPALILFKDGEILDYQLGFGGKQALQSQIEEWRDTYA